jgi:hypothetical protein
MKFTKTLLLASTFLFAGAASATFTPAYTGSTTSDIDLIANTAPVGTDWGYYLWNETAAPRTWNLRWHGRGASEANPTWDGVIVFEQSKLDDSFDGTDNTKNAYQFEFSTVEFIDPEFDEVRDGGDDSIYWEAVTNNDGGIDGFSFTLTDDVEIMEFELGGSLFDGLVGEDVQGTNIFIGSDLNTPNVTFTPFNGGVAQQFEIKVSAPSAFALLGLSLVGLGLRARRRKSTK